MTTPVSIVGRLYCHLRPLRSENVYFRRRRLTSPAPRQLYLALCFESMYLDASRRTGLYALLLALVAAALLVQSSDAFGNATSVIWVSSSGQDPVYTTYAEAIAYCTETSPCKASLTFATPLDASNCEYRLIPGDYSGAPYPQCTNRLSVSFLPGGVYKFDSSFYGTDGNSQVTTEFGTALNSDAQTMTHPLNPANIVLSSTIDGKLASTFLGATVRNTFSNSTHAYLTASEVVMGAGIATNGNILTISNLILVDYGLVSTTNTGAWYVNDCAFLNSRISTSRTAVFTKRNLVFSESGGFTWSCTYAFAGPWTDTDSDILLTSPITGSTGLSLGNTTIQGFGSTATPDVITGNSQLLFYAHNQTIVSNVLLSVAPRLVLMIEQSTLIGVDLTTFNPVSQSIVESVFIGCTFRSPAVAPDSNIINSFFSGDMRASIATCSGCTFTTSSLIFESRPVLINSSIVTSSLSIPSDGASFTNTNVTIQASDNSPLQFSKLTHDGGFLALNGGADVTFDASSNISLDGVALCSTCLVSAYNMELKKVLVGLDGGSLKALLNPSLPNSNTSSWTLHSIQIDGAALDVTELTSLNYKHDGLGISPSNNGSFTFSPSTLIWVDWALKGPSGATIAPELGQTYVLISETNVSSVRAAGRAYEFYFEIANDTSVQFRLVPPAPGSPIPSPVTPGAPQLTPSGSPSTASGPNAPGETSPTPTSSASTLNAAISIILAIIACIIVESH